MRTTNRFFSAVVMLLLTATIAFAAEFTPPEDGRHYGIMSNGFVFVSKAMVDAVEGSAPKLMASWNGWDRVSMKLVGAYYVVDTGRKFGGSIRKTWCVDIGGNRFLPHALDQLDNPNEYLLDEADRVSNGQGGYNFATKPISN